MSENEKTAIPFKILDRVTGDVVYVKAFNGASARNFHTRDRFAVSKLTVAEALTIKPEDIIDGTVDPKQGKLEGV